MGRIIVELDGNHKVAIRRSDKEIISLLDEQFGIELSLKSSQITQKVISSLEKKSSNGIPKNGAIEEFVKSKINYSHNFRIVSKQFLGVILKSNSKDKEEVRKYNILSKRIKRARQKIAQRETNGKWVEDKGKFGAPKTWYFVKS